ncbi:MAG: VWA domain-containing protein, partial [Polaribacter sp.]|nr:VWA domain-containing protein [Polaribacter sp.]
MLILLLINPKIKTTELESLKPVLSVLADNSNSILFFNEDKNITSFLKKIKEDKSINEKFDIQEYSFGSKLNTLDTLTFTDSETNISEAISSINELNENKIAPVVLLTDGNQTIGYDYEFINSNQKIYPILFGDTIQYKDLKISQLNVNKYSYIKNKFPVEVLLNYQGDKTIISQFSISKKGKTIFSKKIEFSPSDNSKTITTNLKSNKEGLHFYTASLKTIKGEKNTINNIKNFSVEVINEQTKILILTSVLHPDLGALKKAIEKNKQRSVDVFLINKFKKKINDYQLVILNQVNNKFKDVFKQIKTKNKNFFLISGTNTNWNFINKQQLQIARNTINQTESYEAVFNNSFLTFSQKDIGFHQFPPLKDKFGDIIISKEHEILLFQKINGIENKQPLLVTFEDNNQKSGVLFGEGFWKWRVASYLNTNTFQDFDEFIDNLIQYLVSNKKRNRLEVNIEDLYPSNSTINIAA